MSGSSGSKFHFLSEFLDLEREYIETKKKRMKKGRKVEAEEKLELGTFVGSTSQNGLEN